MRLIGGIVAVSALALVGLSAIPVNAAGGTSLFERFFKGDDSLRWYPGPGLLPKGAEIAVLEGDPRKEEPVTFRLRFPDGYWIPPHSYTMRAQTTVLEGTLMIGSGKTVDRQTAKAFGPGTEFVLPIGDYHYIWTKGRTVVEVHGTGPWEITYANVADDPRNSAQR